VPNHVISASDVPPEWAGRAIRCHRLEMIPVECIARGYLAGLGLASYQKSGSISGVPLPPSLTEGAKLPEPIFTPTTKAAARHDEPLTYAETVSLVGEEMSAELERITLEIYRWGAALAAERGVLIADTKQEFGRAADGSLMLADEVLTPDSSRFWPADSWVPGRPQHSLDKQFLRDWSATLDWDRTPPGPPIPEEIVATRARYVDVYERLIGAPWKG
jgi:phosphoribosylaminoimidazole-succinocarboxamide synthase